MAVLYNGQKGIWVKKTTDASPVFIGLGQADTPDEIVNKSQEQILNQLGDKVQWSGEDPNQFATSSATGNVSPYSAANPNPVENNYFDTLLSQVEQKTASETKNVEQDYQMFVGQLKQSRDLFNKNLEEDYGKALEDANINVYARGVGESGIKTGALKDTTRVKEAKTAKQDIKDQQALADAQRQREQRLQSIAESDASSKFSAASRASNPYSSYSYT